MLAIDPMALLRHEARTRYGSVPCALGGIEIGPEQYALVGDAFMMRTRDGLAFRYMKGDGVTIERSAAADPADEGLYLNGSVYAAIAVINGFYPIHASAIAIAGQVVAFTGPAGAGKSTLIAELGRRGYPMFCDDTLIVAIRPEGPIEALPGHKRLKLTPEASALTGAQTGERVARTIDKVYARPRAGTVGCPLPLTTLVVLEQADAPLVAPIRGGAAMRALQDDHYTQGLFLAATRPDPAARFAQLAQLARAIRVVRFARPFAIARFAEGVDSLEDWLATLGSAKRAPGSNGNPAS